MDDLSQKIESLLHSPEGMQKIQAAMAALGSSASESGTDSPPAESEAAGGDMLSGLLNGLMGASASDKPADNASSDGMPDMGKLLQLMPLLSSFNKDDENTALLKALRPHLHGEREKRVDDAIQMMKFMKLMPYLTDLKGGSS